MTLIRAGRSVAAGRALCELSYRQFWVSYIALGGSRSAEELLDYIDDQIPWPENEHDAAAHAINEYCHELGLGVPVLYAEEL